MKQTILFVILLSLFVTMSALSAAAPQRQSNTSDDLTRLQREQTEDELWNNRSQRKIYGVLASAQRQDTKENASEAAPAGKFEQRVAESHTPAPSSTQSTVSLRDLDPTGLTSLKLKLKSLFKMFELR